MFRILDRLTQILVQFFPYLGCPRPGRVTLYQFSIPIIDRKETPLND